MGRENRAILLTPPFPAAIAVVRLVGAATEEFLTRHFDRPLVAGRCVHGELRGGDRVIDDPVVVLIENGADLCLHGGPWIVRATLDMARREGFEVVEWTSGPVPLDAVDGDSILLREVLASVPLARTELALRSLLEQGPAWEKVIADRVVQKEMIEDRSLWWLLNPPRVVIVGSANAGKSTLANQLFAQDRSITADGPSTTRDWVGEIANIDGLAVMLIDTPGMRTVPDEIERAAIQHSLVEIRAADLVVLVLDTTVPLKEQQLLLADYPDAIHVANKSDLAAAWDLGAIDAIPTVATNGKGIDALRDAIKKIFGCLNVPSGKPRWWTPRQRDILQRAIREPACLKDVVGEA